LRVEGRVATVAAALDNGRGQDVVYGGDLHHRVEALYGERGVPTYLAHRDVDGWGSMMGAYLIASRPAAILCKLLVCRFVAGSPSARSHRCGRS
jgi:hypothetical protein